MSGIYQFCSDKYIMQYYTYKLIDPRDGIVFYVGVAKITKKSPKGKRPKFHTIEAIRYRNNNNKATKGANLHKIRKILLIIDSNLEVIIDYVGDFDIAEEAFANETKLIQEIGRLDLNTGPLTNLTDGGQGGFNMSEDGRRRVAESTKSRPNPTKGKTLGPYPKERVEKAAEGLRNSEKVKALGVSKRGVKKGPTSPEVKEKISNSLKGRPSPMKGKPSPLKGKKTGPMSEEQKAKMKGRPAYNKGKPSPSRGKTYEELYGPEKAAELKELRRQRKIKYWSEQSN